MRFSRLAIACSLMGLAAGCAPSPYVPVERAMPVERANIPAEWIDPVTHKVSVPIGWNADYKVPADYVPKPGLSDADRAQCDYEAQVATVNSRGILTPIGDYNRIFSACLRARASR
jgi:hypothetical protein